MFSQTYMFFLKKIRRCEKKSFFFAESEYFWAKKEAALLRTAS
jgi:hypothetical protein